MNIPKFGDEYKDKILNNMKNPFWKEVIAYYYYSFYANYKLFLHVYTLFNIRTSKSGPEGQLFLISMLSVTLLRGGRVIVFLLKMITNDPATYTTSSRKHFRNLFAFNVFL